MKNLKILKKVYILYIHTSYQHPPFPPSTLKNIGKNINNRLSRNLANEAIFNASIQPYKEALESSANKFKLKFDPNAKNENEENHLV